VAKAGVTITGADTLARSLTKAAEELEDLEEAQQKTASLIASAAASRAPVGPSGRLAGSIRGRVTKGQVRIESGVPYWGPIHWGWPARNISANPFIVDAAIALESQWVDEYRADAQEALDKVRGA
jgi:hypothetical protein